MKIAKLNLLCTLVLFLGLGLAISCTDETNSDSLKGQQMSTTNSIISSQVTSGISTSAVTSSSIEQQPIGLIVFPTNNYCTSGFNLVISGTASDDGLISAVNLAVDGSSVPVTGTTSWTGTSSGLSIGSHTIELTVVDDQGSSSIPQSINFAVQNSWLPMSSTGAPSGRNGTTAVWDQNHHQMIVWGGVSSSNSYLDSGGIYLPSTDTWTPTGTVNAPSPRCSHTAVWDTNSNTMIIWGGSVSGARTNTGGIYNPDTDSWSTMSIPVALDGRAWHTAVWNDTTNEMIIWGGECGMNLCEGAKYNPATDTWNYISSIGEPLARREHTAVWDSTNQKMIIWGGKLRDFLSPNFGVTDTGGVYDSVANSWVTTSTASGVPIQRWYHSAVWDTVHSEMIVFGGDDGDGNLLDNGARYDPSTDSWTALPAAGSPGEHYEHTAVWDSVNARMIIWGWSASGGANSSDGAIYDTNLNSWTPITDTGSPSDRVDHFAVWNPVNSQMIIWSGNNFLTDGGIFASCP